MIRKKNFIAGVALTALLALSDMTALASETVQAVEVVESFLPEAGESIETVSEIDRIQGTEPDINISQGVEAETETDAAENSTADGIIASGKSGDITWVIDGNGKLTVEGTGDLRRDMIGNIPWNPYKKQITSAEMNVSGMTDVSGWFRDCSNLTSVDVSGFDTSNVRDMKDMFFCCSSLTSVDVSGFDTSNVEHMGYMFSGCSSLTSVDVSGFDTSNVWNMGYMFSDCSSLTSVDVSGFDTSNVGHMGYMFSDCSSLTSVDVSGFDTSNVSDMYGMFGGCSSLTSVDVSGFDTSNVTNMSDMFRNCSNLISVDVSGFDTSNVWDMGRMFYECSSLTSLDLSNVDLSDAKMIVWDDGSESSCTQDIFYGCNKLITVKAFKATPKEARCRCYLPDYFVDEDGNRTNEITAAFVGKTLTRESADIPTPTPAPTPTPTPAPVTPPSGENVQKVRDFVSRMYTVALGRSAEEAGLNDWTNRLLTHEVDGAGIANGFIMSDEFKSRNLSNEDYVDTLYRTFFNREADQGGRATWLAELASGKTRGYVLSGFVNSTEFDNLCDAYGIARGTLREDGSPVNAGIRGFVERCYTKVLGRAGEKAGVEDWTNRIATGQMSAEDVARSFFFSDEYINKHTDNETFVETLYQTFMDRVSDPAGKADWVGRLAAGTGREEVLEGFSRSEEFAGILRSYGL